MDAIIQTTLPEAVKQLDDLLKPRNVLFRCNFTQETDLLLINKPVSEFLSISSDQINKVALIFYEIDFELGKMLPDLSFKTTMHEQAIAYLREEATNLLSELLSVAGTPREYHTTRGVVGKDLVKCHNVDDFRSAIALCDSRYFNAMQMNLRAIRFKILGFIDTYEKNKTHLSKEQ
jgi:hypothetical protein